MTAVGLFIGVLLLDVAILAAVAAVCRVASELGSRYGFAGFFASVVLFPISGTVGAVVPAFAWEEPGPLRWAILSIVSFGLAATVPHP